MRWGRVQKKGGQLSQALSRSRGGFSAKIHVSVDGLGNPLRFTLTAVQEHDIAEADALIENMDSEHVIADRGQGSGQFRESIVSGGAEAMIPSRSNRKKPCSYDRHLYRERHLVECLMGRMKQYRRIFSRFDYTNSA